MRAIMTIVKSFTGIKVHFYLVTIQRNCQHARPIKYKT